MDRIEAAKLTAGRTTGRLLFAVVAVAVFVIDRVTKGMVNARIVPGTEYPLLPHVWLTNLQNSGAAFGMLPAGAGIFLAASMVASAGLVFYVLRHQGSLWTYALLGLIMGGTVGNGYDRLFHGTVTDFVATHLWPVFNVADSAISVGVALLLAGYLMLRGPADQKD